MDLQNMQNHSMHLVLSSDAKPRLKWTPELHQRFLEAVHQLGGAESEWRIFIILVLLSIYYSHLIRIYYMGRGNPKESYEGDGYSRTYLVPLEEPFTGISPFVLILSFFSAFINLEITSSKLFCVSGYRNSDSGKAHSQKPFMMINKKVTSLSPTYGLNFY